MILFFQATYVSVSVNIRISKFIRKYIESAFRTTTKKKDFFPQCRFSSNCLCSINPLHCLCANTTKLTLMRQQFAVERSQNNNKTNLVFFPDWSYCILGNINDQWQLINNHYILHAIGVVRLSIFHCFIGSKSDTEKKRNAFCYRALPVWCIPAQFTSIKHPPELIK